MTARFTLLAYEVKAQVGGKIAQLGARLIDATAKQMADQFFDRFSAEVVSMSATARTGAERGVDDPRYPCAGPCARIRSRRHATGRGNPPWRRAPAAINLLSDDPEGALRLSAGVLDRQRRSSCSSSS